MLELVIAILIGVPILIFLAPWDPGLETEGRRVEKVNEADAAAIASE